MLNIDAAQKKSEGQQTIKNAINQASSGHGDLGAVQNRSEHTGNNLSVIAENIQDAENIIYDTDSTEEITEYVKYIKLTDFNLSLVFIAILQTCFFCKKLPRYQPAYSALDCK